MRFLSRRASLMGSSQDEEWHSLLEGCRSLLTIASASYPGLEGLNNLPNLEVPTGHRSVEQVKA